jgi:hypothetical protein
VQCFSCVPLATRNTRCSSLENNVDTVTVNMGACASKTTDVAPEAEGVKFRLRKTSDGRRLESSTDLTSSNNQSLTHKDTSGDVSKFANRSMDEGGGSENKKAGQVGLSTTATVDTKPKKPTKKKGKRSLQDHALDNDAGNTTIDEDDSLEDDVECVNLNDPNFRSKLKAQRLQHERNMSVDSRDFESRTTLSRRNSLANLYQDRAPEPLSMKEEVVLSDNLKRYKDEPVLEPNTLPTIDGPDWLAPPDVKREDKVRGPKEYTIGGHMKGDHSDAQRCVLSKADFSTYVPGTGPIFNGPMPGFLGKSAKTLGLHAGKLGVAGIAIMSILPNTLFLHRLKVEKLAFKWICMSLILACNMLSLYSIYAFSSQLKRFFWRATLLNSVAICFALGMLCFSWQMMAIYSIAWLNGNRGVFSFLMAAFGGAWLVGRHEANLKRREEYGAVLAAFLEIEKCSKSMTDLMGLPAVRTNEMQYLNAAPIWARYRPDELCEWLNAFLRRVWSFYNKAVSEVLRESLEPLMEASRPSILKRLTFKELDFGESPFVFRSVTYVGKKADDMGVSLDIDFAWAGKSEIVLAAKTHIGADINIAVKDLEIYAKLRISIHPLVPLPSPLGGLVISLTERPVIEFNAELPSGLDMLYSVFDKWLEEFLADVIGDMLIQPERIVVPLSFNFDPIVMPDGEIKPFKWYDSNILQLHNTGVLKVTVIKAENIPRTDTFSKTDPYITLQVKKSGVLVKTTVKQNDEDPTWDETFYIPVDDAVLRTLKVSVYDSDNDPFGMDDRLAVNNVSISEIVNEPNGKEMWLTFPEQLKGNKAKPPMRLLLETQYIMFGSAAAKDLFSGMGLLSVTILRGINLMVMDSNGLSDPYVKVKMPVEAIGNQISGKQTKGSKKAKQFVEYVSKVHKKNLNPEFNEKFEFSPADENSKVIIELFDVDSTFPVGKKSNFMGNIEVPISVILEQGGSMEARFKVGNATRGELDIIFEWQSYC